MRQIAFAFVLLFVFGCQGWTRSCASSCAQDFGADWLIVQYSAQGDVLNCWRLEDVSIANESSSDGIYWQAEDGHLVHISGWYNRVQVQRKDWDGAGRALGVDLRACPDGKYLNPPAETQDGK